jgi:hypothetical protein
MSDVLVSSASVDAFVIRCVPKPELPVGFRDELLASNFDAKSFAVAHSPLSLACKSLSRLEELLPLTVEFPADDALDPVIT